MSFYLELTFGDSIYQNLLVALVVGRTQWLALLKGVEFKLCLIEYFIDLIGYSSKTVYVKPVATDDTNK